MLNRLALAGTVYGLAPTPESQVRIRLPAGGRRMRTLGPSRGQGKVGVERRRLEKRPPRTGDRGFESPYLQRGVMCEPDSSIGAELSAPSVNPG